MEWTFVVICLILVAGQLFFWVIGLLAMKVLLDRVLELQLSREAPREENREKEDDARERRRRIYVVGA